jgi:hypothetical protein
MRTERRIGTITTIMIETTIMIMTRTVMGVVGVVRETAVAANLAAMVAKEEEAVREAAEERRAAMEATKDRLRLRSS